MFFFLKKECHENCKQLISWSEILLVGGSITILPGTTHQNSWGCKQAAMKNDPDNDIKKMADGDPIPSSPK